MTSKKTSFLHAVIGNDGAKALVKATAQDEELTWAIVPGSIMSWLEAVSLDDFNDNLPGVPDTKLTLNKSETNYNGSINIGREVYDFKDVSLFHVAGSIAVALGSDQKAPDLSNPSLSKLAKSVSLLVKSRTLRKMQQKGKAKGVEPKGSAAPPLAPLPPAQNPIAAPKTSQKVNHAPKQAELETNPEKAPIASKPKKMSLKVSKSESMMPCSTCSKPQFNDSKFVGCSCMAALAKSVKVTVVNNSYVLEFGKDWDFDGVLLLSEMLGK